MEEPSGHVRRDLEVVACQENTSDLRHCKLLLGVHTAARPCGSSQKRIKDLAFEKAIAVIEQDIGRSGEGFCIEDLPPLFLGRRHRLNVTGADRGDDGELGQQRLPRSN